MDVLGTATIEEAAERPELDKSFREFLQQPDEANKVVFAENLALALIQVAAYDNGYITTYDCPSLIGATKVDVLTVEVVNSFEGDTHFTYSVNGGEPLKGQLSDVYGCVFAL